MPSPPDSPSIWIFVVAAVFVALVLGGLIGWAVVAWFYL